MNLPLLWRRTALLLLALLLVTVLPGAASQPAQPSLPAGTYRIEGVADRDARNAIIAAGVAIDGVGPDYVEVTVNARDARRLAALGYVMRPVLWSLAQAEVDEAYHTYAEMVAEIQQVAGAHPELVQLSSIGTSHEGRTLWLARVASTANPDLPKPEALFIGHYHAREHLTVEMMLGLLHLLVDNYGQTGQEQITRLVDRRVIWLIFDLNPDGGEHDIADGFYKSWRKNRQDNSCTVDTGFGPNIGTDMNRNHSYKWGLPGASDDPCSDNYRGLQPASAPEIKALEDFVRSRVVGGEQRITVAISFHTYGELILWPYGYTAAQLPSDMDPTDYQVLATMGRAMAQTNGYQGIQSNQLYTTSGDFNDWAYGSQRIFAYTFEMYGRQYGFYPPGTLIKRETERNFPAVLYLLEQADCPYRVTGAISRCAIGTRFSPPQRVWLPQIAKF
ncbi:MAG: M14 family metallopeptidase [Roseiflexaceae bacterium]